MKEEQGATSFFDELASIREDEAEKELNSSVSFEDDVEEVGATSDQQDVDINSNEGRLPPEAKQALVYLYRFGSVLMEQNQQRFDVLCRFESEIRSHLADVYMRLVIDRKAGHVFTEVMDGDDMADYAPLITTKPLSLYQSILLVVLRKFFQERETAGEQHIVIDRERLESFLVPYMTLSNSTKKVTERLKSAINSLIEKRLLMPLRGEEGRYQISPIIRNVVNTDLLETLEIEYKKMLGEDDSGHSEGNSDE